MQQVSSVKKCDIDLGNALKNILAEEMATMIFIEEFWKCILWQKVLARIIAIVLFRIAYSFMAAS